MIHYRICSALLDILIVYIGKPSSKPQIIDSSYHVCFHSPSNIGLLGVQAPSTEAQVVVVGESNQAAQAEVSQHGPCVGGCYYYSYFFIYCSQDTSPVISLVLELAWMCTYRL